MEKRPSLIRTHTNEHTWTHTHLILFHIHNSYNEKTNGRLMHAFETFSLNTDSWFIHQISFRCLFLRCDQQRQIYQCSVWLHILCVYVVYWLNLNCRKWISTFSKLLLFHCLFVVFFLCFCSQELELFSQNY